MSMYQLQGKLEVILCVSRGMFVWLAKLHSCFPSQQVQAFTSSVASCLIQVTTTRAAISSYRIRRARPFVSITHHQLSPPTLHTMSTVPSTSTSHSNFAFIFNAALEKYNRNTKQDLANHPLLPRFQSCHSAEDILTVLRERSLGFNQSHNSDDGFTNWVTPTVNVMYSFSTTLGGVVGLVNIAVFLYGIVKSDN